ncbi:MAG: hypothetical protein ABEJ24_01820 [Candidatus Magasanikbacteria bacterium]
MFRKILGGSVLFLGLFFIIFNVSNASSCPVNTQSAYSSPKTSAVYYITKNCTKRPFKKPDVFFSYFTSWDAVKNTTTQTLNSIPTDQLGFMPWGPLKFFKSGSLIKTVNDSKVYVLLGQKKCWFKNEKVFNELGYSFDWVRDVDPRKLSDYKTCANPISYTDHHPPGTLITYRDSSDVYVLKKRDGKIKKDLIKNETEFNSYNYRWDRIIIVNMNETYPTIGKKPNEQDKNIDTSTDYRETRKRFCKDGTSVNSCSDEKPKYCNKNGTLVKKPGKCGCPLGGEPESGECVWKNNCSDGTPEGSCSSKKPLFCMDGHLVSAARECGCPSGTQRVGRSCLKKDIQISKPSSCNTKCGDGICQESEKFGRKGRLKYRCPRDCVSKSKYSFYTDDGSAMIISPKDKVQESTAKAALDNFNKMLKVLPKIVGHKSCSETQFIWERVGVDPSSTWGATKLSSGWQLFSSTSTLGIKSFADGVSNAMLHEYAHAHQKSLQDKYILDSWFAEGMAMYVEETFVHKFKPKPWNYKFEEAPSIKLICEENGFRKWKWRQGSFGKLKKYKDINSKSFYDIPKNSYENAYCLLKRIEKKYGREGIRNIHREIIRASLENRWDEDKYNKVLNDSDFIEKFVIPATGEGVKKILRKFGFNPN